MSGERIDLDMIEQRVIAAGDAWRGQKPASVAFLAYDATALLAEVRRLTDALAEANDEARQFDADRFVERARAERAEAALAEVAALHTNVYHRKMYAEFWACGECDYPATGPDDYCPTATLARADEADR